MQKQVRKNNVKSNLFKDAIDYFKQIAKVYHGSGDLNQCQTWLKHLINKLGVDVYCDNYNTKMKYGNLYIELPATDPKLESVIIQAHYDMVVVTNDLDKMRKHGVELVQENGVLHSMNYKTSIGADDCIGVALILSIIKNRNNFKHGKIKFLITGDEETSMLGAKAALKNHLKWFNYKYFVNLDATYLNYIFSGCYAGIHNQLTKTFKTVGLQNKNIYEISLSGLMGGHSGSIDNTQANAIVLLFKLLSKLDNVQLIGFHDCGNKVHNAIPRESKAIFSCSNSILEIKKYWNELDFATKFPKETNMCFIVSHLSNKYNKGLSIKDSKSLINIINELPLGAHNKFMTLPIANLYYTTCNVSPLFSFNTNKPYVNIELRSFVRTYVQSQIKKTNDKLINIAKKYNFVYKNISTAPVWKQKKNSKLQQAFIKVNKQIGIDSISVPTPVCVESCWFANKIKNLDIVSIGDGIKDAHLPTESLILKPYKNLCDSILIFLQSFK